MPRPLNVLPTCAQLLSDGWPRGTFSRGMERWLFRFWILAVLGCGPWTKNKPLCSLPDIPGKKEKEPETRRVLLPRKPATQRHLIKSISWRQMRLLLPDTARKSHGINFCWEQYLRGVVLSVPLTICLTRSHKAHVYKESLELFPRVCDTGERFLWFKRISHHLSQTGWCFLPSSKCSKYLAAKSAG